MRTTTNIGAPTYPPVCDDYIGIRIDRKTKEKIKQLAQQDHRTISSYLQVLLWNHVANAASHPDQMKSLPLVFNDD